MRALVTGVGVVSAVGQGRDAFLAALLEGRHAFGVMTRPGRQMDSSFLGAEIESIALPANLSDRLRRISSWSAQAALATIGEAWSDAALEQFDPGRIGLVIGGSNIQQRDLVGICSRYGDRPHLAAPSHALAFMDTDLCGICTEHFGIRGPASTVGGASASGQVAILHALDMLRSGRVDACIAVGALQDISYLECHAFRNLGAMGTDRFADRPAEACRPFDRDRDGFIYGESCAALVLEREDSRERHARIHGVVAGSAMAVDANRNPNPSLEGEMRVIRGALEESGVPAREIDYVNPHGSGSVVGDEVECEALGACGLEGALVNATKSITGHGLSASGAVEVVATLLQMSEGKLHPSRNLVAPLRSDRNWVGATVGHHRIRRSLCLSHGFGGINTAIVVEKAV